MKRIITIITMFLVLNVCTSTEKKEILPAGIIYKKLPDGTHAYTFFNIKYQEEAHKTVKPIELFKYCTVPGLKIKSATLDLDKNFIKLIVHNKLPRDKLILLCDRNAKICGLLPYWEEYVIRDNKADNYNGDLYQKVYEESCYGLYPSDSNVYSLEILKIDKVNPHTTRIKLFYRKPKGNTGLSIDLEIKNIKGKFTVKVGSEHKMESNSEFHIIDNIRFGKEKTGKLSLNRRTALCMCHDYFMLRLFKGDKYIWEKEIGFHDFFTFACADLDSDSIDEIIILTNAGLLQIYKRNNYKKQKAKKIE